eukprot:scaffold494881_cov63-Attheya_sp.AAC.1
MKGSQTNSGQHFLVRQSRLLPWTKHSYLFVLPCCLGKFVGGVRNRLLFPVLSRMKMIDPLRSWVLSVNGLKGTTMFPPDEKKLMSLDSSYVQQ